MDEFETGARQDVLTNIRKACVNGHRMEESHAFCPQCGSAAAEVAASNQSAPFDKVVGDRGALAGAAAAGVAVAAPPSAPPAPPVPGAPASAPAKRPWYKRKLVIAGLMLVALIIAAAAAGSQSPTKSTSSNDSSTATKPVNDTAPEPAAPVEPAYDTPVLGDFALSLKTLQNECFGSAGGLVTYRVIVETTRILSLDPDIEYELTYRITGGEDGPEINTLTIQGDESSTEREQSISTASCSKKLAIKGVSLDEL